MYTHLPKFYL